MKKAILLLTVLAALVTAETRACDICGCGVGSYYIGILPEFGKRIIGVRYRYNSLVTHIGAGGAYSYLTTQERYRTMDIWGGWNIGTRFRAMAYVPVNFNEKTNQGVTTHKNGIGDVALLGYYRLLGDEKTTGSRRLVQSLWIGGGIKLPTGRYEPAQTDNTLQSANIFQLGTASVDFTLNAMYDIRLQDFGINTTASYKMNTVNSDQYRYGNKFSANVQTYYKYRFKNRITFAPNAGMLYETSDKDLNGKYIADISGGYALLATAGLEVSVKRFTIGANWQPPVSQHLAGGFVKANDRMMVHVSVQL